MFFFFFLVRMFFLSAFFFLPVDSFAFEPGRLCRHPSHPHSWLSDFRSVHGGRSQYSRCCYLIIDLGSRLSTEAWPGPRRSHLISAVELDGVDTISFLYAPFSFFRPFPVFYRAISSQDRLATTIANSVDP